jgi:uncharacterized membrane protein YuzA (DUF378 family)
MKDGGCCWVCKIVKLLAGIGALNWGLVALVQVDVVARLFGDMTPLTKGVYVLVGIAGLITLVSLIKPCPCCKPGGGCAAK